MSERRDTHERDHDPEGLGGVVDELASTPLIGDALTRLVDVGERAFRAQQGALSALGLPSGSQFESLTLRVRTIFHRIEELEDELDRVVERVAVLEQKLASATKSGAATAGKAPAGKRPTAKRPTAKHTEK